MPNEYYSDYHDLNFDKGSILNKYEFKEQEKRNFIYQEPRQLLIRNLISKNTIYDNILLFHNLGSGKTISAISIAEGFKEYVSNMGRKILVLVKNGNIEKNFKNELITDATRNAYISKKNEEFLKTSKSSKEKKELQNKITRKINKMYNFVTYGSFVNQVLGIKQFEKDEFGMNTTKQKKNKQGELLRKNPSNVIEDLNNTVIIIDEAHNVTNNDIYIALSKVLRKSYNYRLVLLTATPMYDNPTEIIEISNLLNMNDPKFILPIRGDLFKDKNPIMIKSVEKVGLLKGGTTKITKFGESQLINSMKGKVSYLQSNTNTFPKKIDIGQRLLNKVGSINVIYCEMSSYQNNIYEIALKIDSKTKENQDNEGEGEENGVLEKQENNLTSSSLYKNSSDSSTMTYPNNQFGRDGFMNCFIETKGDFKLKPEYLNILTTDLKMYSSKLHSLLNNLNKSSGNIFIYSNYVNYGGTGLLKQLLLANGYVQYKSNSISEKTFILYDDSTTIEIREAQRKIFNSKENKDGKYIRIIIGSPVISEGITLKNVRQVHILEPAWNMSRINQIIGRAVRHRSHDNLEIQERNVEIYKYCSISNKGNQKFFVDKEKYILSEEKDRSNKVVERILKEISFDCNINSNVIIGSDNTPECDYTNCKYSCLIKDNNKISRLDKSTYNLYINFFDKFDIEFSISFIKDIFKKYFVFSIDDLINRIQTSEPMISRECIFNSLKQMIDNKIIIVDQYNRDGFLIQKSDYIIFNPIDININTSIYSKMLNFSVDLNKYNLSEYILKKNIENNLPKIIEKPLKKIQQKVIISDTYIKYNNKIIKNNSLYGSYRERATKISTNAFGEIDNKFRIIDTRDFEESEDDKRKNISGMAATSYNKKKLLNIIKYLKISLENVQDYLEYPSDNIQVDKLNIDQLVSIIETHFKKNNLLLK